MLIFSWQFLWKLVLGINKTKVKLERADSNVLVFRTSCYL